MAVIPTVIVMLEVMAYKEIYSYMCILLSYCPYSY